MPNTVSWTRSWCRSALQLVAIAGYGLETGAQPSRQVSDSAPRFAQISIAAAADTGARGIRLHPGGRFTATGVTIRELIAHAYQRHAFDRREVVGGPTWIDSARFDIVATAPTEHWIDADGAPRRTWTMVRALLLERVSLRMREEYTERPVYALVPVSRGARLGPKLRRSNVDCGAVMRGEERMTASETPPCGMKILPGRLFANTFTMPSIASLLSQHLDRMAIDRTGLLGRFDVELEAAEIRAAPNYKPGPSDLRLPPAAGTPIFIAVREQLGLRLEPRIARIPLLVVERANQPVKR